MTLVRRHRFKELPVMAPGTKGDLWQRGDAAGRFAAIPGPTGHDGYVLAWNDTTGLWEPRAASGGGGSLATLSDANISSPANLDLLQYQTSDNKWHNVATIDAAKIGSGTMATARLGSGSASSSTFLRGDGTWAVVGTGGSSFSTYTKFEPDVPEASPSSQDDEFDNASLSGIWTQVNWQSGGANMSYDIDTTTPGALFVSFTATGNNTSRALLQAIPAGDFTIETMIDSGIVPNNYVYLGLMLADGTTAGAGNQLFVGFVSDGSNSQPYFRIYAQTWQNFTDTGITTRAGPNTWGATGGVVKIFRNSTTYTMHVSPDGRSGRTSGALTLGFTPTYMGILLKNNTSVTGAACFKYFRYHASGNYNFGKKVAYATS